MAKIRAFLVCRRCARRNKFVISHISLLRALATLSLIAAGVPSCGGDGGSTPTYTIGGVVTGLSGSGLQLQDAHAGTVKVTSNGAFSFSTTVPNGTSYAVSVTGQPVSPSQTCRVVSGSGTVASRNVTSISVTCTTNSYVVSGSVSGLLGSGLVLQDNGNDNLAVATNGAFTFSSAVQSGSPYSITVATQPDSPAQRCGIANASGKVGAVAISNVDIVCATTISVASSLQVGAVGNEAAESLLQLSSLVGERLGFLAANIGPHVTEVCPDPDQKANGSATYTFTDADKDGAISAGDSVTIVLDNCFSGSFGRYINTTIDVSIESPPQPANYALGFTAMVGLANTQLPIGEFTVGNFTGNVRIVDTQADVKRVAQVQVISPGVSIEISTGTSDSITVVSLDASKIVDYVAARYQVQISEDFKSQSLQGEFTLATPTQLSGRLNIFPDSGAEDFNGGGSVLQLAAQDIPQNSYIDTSLDADGSGKFVSLGSNALFWEEEFTGFVWWEPQVAPAYPSAPPYETQPLSQWGMALMFAEPQADRINNVIGTNLSVNTPVTLFFSGPVDTSKTSFSFVPSNQLGAIIPAIISADGAVVHVTPQTQLEHGFTYELQAGNGGNEEVFSTLSPNPAGFNAQSITTQNNLQADGSASPAVASPGQTVSLVSSRSFSTNSTIAHYSWRQTGGTPVVLSAATAATASYAVPMGVANGSVFSFQLTVADVNGETDSVPVTAFVLTDLTQPFLYYRQAQGAASGQAPELPVHESPLTSTITDELDQGSGIFRFFSSAGVGDGLQIQLPGQSIAVGTYVSTPPIISFSLLRSPIACQAPTTTFVVREVVAGAGNTVGAFATDFEQDCGNGLPPVFGSLRVNSTIQLP
jgi:hypothetical protein